MSNKLELIKVPDKRLRTLSQEISIIDDNTKELINAMFDIMYESNGIGLAAIQVGIPQKLLIVDISSYDAQHQPTVFINPVLHSYSQEKFSMEEGCLSVPSGCVSVMRSASVSIDYTDIDGKRHSKQLNQMLARVVLHEYDHLLGRLIIDYLPKSKKDDVLYEAQKDNRGVNIQDSPF